MSIWEPTLDCYLPALMFRWSSIVDADFPRYQWYTHWDPRICLEGPVNLLGSTRVRCVPWVTARFFKAITFVCSFIIDNTETEIRVSVVWIHPWSVLTFLNLPTAWIASSPCSEARVMASLKCKFDRDVQCGDLSVLKWSQGFMCVTKKRRLCSLCAGSSLLAPVVCQLIEPPFP